MATKIKRYLVLAGLLLLQLNQLLYAQQPAAGNNKKEQKMIPLADALTEIQQAFHVNFNYNPALISGKYVPEKKAHLSGVFSEAGMTELLGITGLKLIRLGKDDYLIKAADAAPAPHKTEAAHENAADKVQRVSGIVTGEKGEALPGATVTETATGKTVVTDGDGHYIMQLSGAQPELLFRSVGYADEKVPVNGLPSLNIQLKTSVKDLNNVVVTALGIKRQEKALGYSIATLDGSKVNTVKEVNVVNALSGKVAGVDIRSVSSDPGASVLINIRGISSFNDNQPLFVVDGVPIVSGNRAPVQPVGQVTVDYGSPVADINPDDIASITVLKGASAAALYGSRAGNGVILITTKSGNGGNKKSLGVSVNSTAMFDKAWQFPEFQNVFGAGDATGSVDPTNTLSEASWGPRLNVGTKHLQWNSPTDANGHLVPTDWIAYPNRVKDFYQTGATYTNNIAVTGNNFRLSYTNLSNKGITPNTDLQRNTLNLSAGYHLHPAIKLATNVSYINNHSNNRPTFNRGSSSSILYTMPANIDSRQLKNYWKPGQEGLQQFSQDQGNTDNPYFVAYELTNGYTRNRFMGNVQLTIDINKHLSVMARTGIDFFTETDESKRAFSAVKNPNGGYGISDLFNSEQNTDFLITYKHSSLKNWSFSVSAGGNTRTARVNSESQYTGNLVIPGLYNIANAQAGTISSNSYKSKRRVNSVYGMGEIAYKNYAFLDLTARNDWSSTLPPDNNAYFYPSASLSLVLSDMLHISSKTLSFAKLRLNVSKVGKDTDPYNLYNSFYFSSPDWGNNVKMADFSTVLKNNHLKPEQATSFEIGADLRFFGGRLAIDATYYNTNNRNQIVNIPTTMSSGYSAKIINAGEIRNRGWEIGVNGTPIAGRFKWDIGVNFTRNYNKVIRLTDGITSYLQGSAEGVQYQIREGQSMGDMYGRTWTTVPDGPYKGQQLLDKSGSSQYAPDLVKIGNYNPDFMTGITNSFTYKRFTLNTLVDWRQGGQFFSYVFMNLLSDGRTTTTLAGRDAQTGGLKWNDGRTDRNDGMIEEGYIADGNGGYIKNTHITDPENYYGDYYWKMHSRNTFSATYVKLREVSLSYQIGRASIGKMPFSNVSVALIARNLFSWTAAGKGYDPETAMTISSGSITPGTTSWSLPYTRSYGVKLGFNF